MKAKSISLLAPLMFCAIAVANEQPRKVSGTVWKDGHTRASFDLRVRAGEAQRVPINDGEALEVLRSHAAGTVVRLIDAAGKQLATAALGDGVEDASIRFAFCPNGGVEVSSPAPQSDPQCRAE